MGFRCSGFGESLVARETSMNSVQILSLELRVSRFDGPQECDTKPFAVWPLGSRACTVDDINPALPIRRNIP